MGKPAAMKSYTGKLVVSALKNLTRNTGWTSRTITKFIRMEYEIQDPKLGRKVSSALKRGARLGVVQKERGRYRLNNMSSLVRTVSAQEVRMQQQLTQQQQERPTQRPLKLRSRSPSATL